MNDEMEKAERLFQQLSGNETTKNENLDHLKVCFQGSNEYGSKIIKKLKELDNRVRTPGYIGTSEGAYYFVDPSSFGIEFTYEIPNGYKLLYIEDYLDEEEDMDTYYCPMCGEEIDSYNETMYYSDGDECCQSCYDEDLDMEEEDEEDLFEHPTPRVSDLERAENTFRLLSETQSASKDVIESKLSELNNITRRRRR